MKTTRIALATLLALTVSVPGFAHEGKHEKCPDGKGQAPTMHQKQAASGKALSLKLSGLHCEGCAMGVQSKLLQVPGIAGAVVSAKNQSATVTLARGAKRPTDAALKAAVKAAGYTCTAVKG